MAKDGVLPQVTFEVGVYNKGDKGAKGDTGPKGDNGVTPTKQSGTI